MATKLPKKLTKRGVPFFADETAAMNDIRWGVRHVTRFEFSEFETDVRLALQAHDLRQLSAVELMIRLGLTPLGGRLSNLPDPVNPDVWRAMPPDVVALEAQVLDAVEDLPDGDFYAYEELAREARADSTGAQMLQLRDMARGATLT